MSKRPLSETVSQSNKSGEADEFLEELKLYEARKRYNVALKVGAACAVPKPALPQTPEPGKRAKKQVTFDSNWGNQLEELHCRERRMEAAEQAMWNAKKLTAKVAAQPCGK